MNIKGQGLRQEAGAGQFTPYLDSLATGHRDTGRGWLGSWDEQSREAPSSSMSL